MIAYLRIGCLSQSDVISLSNNLYVRARDKRAAGEERTVTRAEKAEGLFKEGYNCAQSVVLAFADVLDADEETLKAVAAPFGGGMGRLREVCGAVSGMFMVAGLSRKWDTLERESKNALYALERRMAEKFAEQTGSIVCRELLLSRPHGDTHNSKKPKCKELVGIAARIVEDELYKSTETYESTAHAVTED